ncbi:beta-phosphoglucomutase [Aquibacillus sediminis]|uniref:beta-phosphoglucomutase n=1 Tax=Aquibacillus sediminis TaxID=2574734 RepID=UPI0011088381|nr:beta-phosphoglucomutase [Aquibacillus sediminis]
MTQFPKAFIFDLDGVITDTAEFHYLAWKELGKELGVTIGREFNEQLKGISRMDSLDRILGLDPSLTDMPEAEKEQYATKKNEHYKRLIETVTPAHILPGVKGLLEEIKQHDIEIALGSASKNAPAVLKQLGLMSYFDYLVDAAKVSKGKPDPETFTTASDGLGVAYQDCIGIEDAQAGVEAINQAHMFSVGVGELLKNTDHKVATTEQLDFQTILTKYAEWRNKKQ